MKRVLMHLWVVSALLVLSVGTAGAQSDLHLTGWLVCGGSAHVKVFDGDDWHDATYGAGSFRGFLDGHALGGPIYCLDIFHSFHFGEHWDVTPIVVPPDPPNPPPFNTAEASWLYHKYGRTGVGYQAGGVQLALWEISHQLDWNTAYGMSPNWAGTGDFQYIGSTSSNTIGGYATTILADLYYNYDPDEAGHCYYYEPFPRPGDPYYGQGQMGDIPEPGTLILLGMGVLSFAGVAWRKRKQ